LPVPVHCLSFNDAYRFTDWLLILFAAALKYVIHKKYFFVHQLCGFKDFMVDNSRKTLQVSAQKNIKP
jgi:hypothetical protein